MSDYDAIDYVPIIGDIYRYAKIGYKIGGWLGNLGNDYNDRIISNIADCLNKTTQSTTLHEINEHLEEAISYVHEFNGDNCKKYQLALMLFLGARLFHIIAIYECIIHSDDLDNLKKAKKTFSEAKEFCNKVWTIDKTLFTQNRSLIDEIREASNNKKEEIRSSKKQWRKQYRCLYKKTHPIKWYFIMWIFA